MKLQHAFLLPLLLVAGLAAAGDRYVPIEQRLDAQQRHATGIDTLTPAQLEALNAVLRGETEQVEAKVEARVRAETPAAAPPKAADGSFIGMDQSPIRSRLKGSIASWEPGTEFVLENGQTWKVLKGSMKLRKPLQAPEILLVPGIAGRWFLQVDEDLPKARVYRVD
jgi:hypothetical protein